MTKYIIIALLIIPFLSIAQVLKIENSNKDQYKNQLGGSLGNGGYSGLLGQVYFKRKISKDNYLRTSVYSNSKHHFGASLGWRKDLFSYKRFSLSSGLDIRFDHFNNSKFDLPNNRKLPNAHRFSMVLPVDLDIRVTDRLTFNMGYSHALKTFKHKNPGFNQNKSHFGISYRF